MTDDLISSATSAEAVPPSSEEATPSSAVNELVGEGKKFKDVDSLASAKLESDKFIEQLKFENEAMRKEIGELSEVRSNSKTIEDVLAALQSREQNEVSDNQAGTNSADVEDVVRNILNQEQAKQSAMSNRASVSEALTQRFGGDEAKAKEFIQQTVKSNGMTGEQFANLVDTAPGAAKSILGLNSQSNQPNVSISAMGAQGEAPRSGTVVRNQSYYKALKKEMGTRKFYEDIKLQQQMYKDADSLGDDYFK